MCCQEQSKLNSMHLRRTTQWVKRTVVVEAGTPNTGKTLWLHCALTCRVMQLTLDCRFCMVSLHLNFFWQEWLTRLLSGICCVDVSHTAGRVLAHLKWFKDFSRSKYLGLQEITSLCPSNYAVFSPIGLPFFSLMLSWSLPIVSNNLEVITPKTRAQIFQGYNFEQKPASPGTSTY